MRTKESKQYTRYIKDPLIEPYYIQLDDYCYAVQKGITAGESGKEYQQTLGYYTSLSNALEAIARDETMSVSYDTIQEFINTYNQIMNRLSKVIKI
jgi:Asp-tRNA(Asn)/Glu-tRNA(Gln) amidotransferase B subunit